MTSRNTQYASIAMLQRANTMIGQSETALIRGVYQVNLRDMILIFKYLVKNTKMYALETVHLYHIVI